MTNITAPSDNKDASIIAIIADLEAKRDEAYSKQPNYRSLPESIAAQAIYERAAINAIPLLIEAYRAKVDECARLEKDAERYRWIRDIGDATWTPLIRRDPSMKYTFAAIRVDAYIDAALHPEAVSSFVATETKGQEGERG